MELRVVRDRRVDLRECAIDVVLFDYVVVRDVVVSAGEVVVIPAAHGGAGLRCEVRDNAADWRAEFTICRGAGYCRQSAARLPSGQVRERRPRGRVVSRPGGIERV